MASRTSAEGREGLVPRPAREQAIAAGLLVPRERAMQRTNLWFDSPPTLYLDAAGCAAARRRVALARRGVRDDDLLASTGKP